MAARICQFFLATAGILLAACASAPSTPPASHTASHAAHTPPRGAATAAAIERVLAGDQRSAENRARDAAGHPVDTLLFFGIKPDMTVVEMWPGADGWYTEILAPLLAERGKLYATTMPPAPDNEYLTTSLRQFDQKLAAHPDLYGKVTVTRFGAASLEVAPPGSADLIVAFRNVHNWMSLGLAKDAFAAMFRALKPGGVLGVVDHRGRPDKPQDPRAASGYVNEQYAIDLATSAGFVLDARSEVNANPKDTKDYEQGVWVLPPDYRAGNRDRAKFERIGESDRFTLRFVKPR